MKGTKKKIVFVFLLLCASCFRRIHPALKDTTMCVDSKGIVTDCELVEYLEKEGGVHTLCLKPILIYLYDKTGHDPSIVGTTGGVTFKNDSLFKVDIKVWKEELGCEI